MLGCLVSPSHHCREGGGEVFEVPLGSELVCGECTGDPVSSGAFTSKKNPRGWMSGVPGYKGGVLSRLAS